VRLELVTGLRPGRDPHRRQQHTRRELERVADHQPGIPLPRIRVVDRELVTNAQLLGGQHELGRAELYRLDRHRSTSLPQASLGLVVDVDGGRGGALWMSRCG
jgi:hypothetical protein